MDFNTGPFKALDTNPGGTLEAFIKYVDRIKLIFDLAFRKSDGTPYEPSNKEKKSMLLFRGGDDMKDLFELVGKVVEADTFDQAITKIQEGLKGRTNAAVQRNLLFTNHPQGTKSFERWSKDITNTAKLISYTNYDWKSAAVDAMLLQTSNPKLRERALQEDIDFEKFMKLGIAKEQSTKGAAQLEQASSHSQPTPESEEVRRLRTEMHKLKKKQKPKKCDRCGYSCHKNDNECPAMGKICSKCEKPNHFAQACRSKTPSQYKQKPKSVRRVSSSDESDSSDTSTEDCRRVIVGRLQTAKSALTNISVGGINSSKLQNISAVTDTGVNYTLLNRNDWDKVKKHCLFKKTSKNFRPYGIDTGFRLPIRGEAELSLQSKNGANISTVAYILDDRKEQSLLGKYDAIRLGIVTLNPDGSKEEVMITDDDEEGVEILRRIIHIRKSLSPGGIVSGGETQAEIDMKMQKKVKNHPKLFSERTGRFTGETIRIHLKEGAEPKVAPHRPVPHMYQERFAKELKNMLRDGVVTGPLEDVDPESYISNLVITTKKKDSNKIRVTLDCQAVNADIHPSYEPIPTIEQLRHKLKGSDRFSVIDITNCYHQFPLEESAKKLYCFRTPEGIFRYETLVQGTSPASGEAQKKIRELIKSCTNSLNIKDDILIHGKGQAHDEYLDAVLKTLQNHGLTLRLKKCDLGRPQVKWFGYVFSKDGMSPDPEKCNIIKEWPAPTNTTEVKSFLQTVQFNKKFLSGKNGGKSFPDLTEPLRRLTRKNIKFRWSREEEEAFQEIKCRLCSDDVMVPYDTNLKTRLYVDSSPIGTQATLAQLHRIDDEGVWRPVNYTSRSWTPTESRYSQIERESNGILSGMCMNKLYTLGTHVTVVTDHKPLVPAYNSPKKRKQLRVDRHRTKLLPYTYNVIYEPGSTTPSDYGSRHPPPAIFSSSEKRKWHVEDSDTEIIINAVISNNLPSAVTTAMLKAETAKDKDLCTLMEDICKRGYCTSRISRFKKLFPEFTVIDGMVMRENRVVIPSSLQADVIGLSHEPHMGIDKTVNLLRETCWFPNMHKMVTDYVQSCFPCAASVPYTRPVPLKPQYLPDRPWQKLHADFKGPIGGKYYLHVLIDQYSKYPEVDIVKSTSFDQLEPCFNRIFATHGIPEEITSDNGSPYFADEMADLAKKTGFKHHRVTPEDPQSNGFAESFVKVMVKFVHTTIAEGKDPKRELQNYLLHYRAAPHTSTGISPAEALFNRKLKTRLPQFRSHVDSAVQKQMRVRHDEIKDKQKKYFDKGRRATEKFVKPGDKVLVRQKKTTTSTPFDPKPFSVTKVKGNRVTSRRGNQVRVRSKNHIKVVPERPAHLVRAQQKVYAAETDFDFDTDISHIINPGTASQLNTPTAVTAESLHNESSGEDRQPSVLIPNNNTAEEDERSSLSADLTESTPLFHLEEEERIRMQNLFENVLASMPSNSIECQDPDPEEEGSIDEDGRGTKKKLRSAQRNLQWNPEMNGDTVVMESS